MIEIYLRICNVTCSGVKSLNNSHVLIGRQSGMVVRMSTPINQVFNYESIAVQILFLDVYT